MFDYWKTNAPVVHVESRETSYKTKESAWKNETWMWTKLENYWLNAQTKFPWKDWRNMVRKNEYLQEKDC